MSRVYAFKSGQCCRGTGRDRMNAPTTRNNTPSGPVSDRLGKTLMHQQRPPSHSFDSWFDQHTLVIQP